MKTIGFIGLGIMGSRMARNLQKAGYSLIVYNRTQEKAQELVTHGAKLANSISEVAQDSDIVITMLSTPEIVLEIAQGENGLLQNMKSDALWINSSTINPSAAKEFGVLAQQHTIRYIDAPVAGTKGPAEAGELLFLVGGTTTDFEEASPLLDIMGKKTLHLGDVGAGSSMKMLINQLLGQQMVAFAEALSMGTQMGMFC
jgi:3-hydroxyisobutyrate dehydrogenase/glyoxylate/succinic semialdehyde reductase